MFLLIFFVVLLFAIIIIFAFPRFSPVPYFPSNGKDMPLILKALHIRNNQTIIDLGAGDGIIIFKAADVAYEKELNTKYVAVEINPVLLTILHIRRLFHPNRKNIRIINADMFSMNYSFLISNLQSPISTHKQLTTFYIYISPWFIDKTIMNIVQQIKEFELISYFYQVKSLPKYKEELNIGIHNVFSYQSP